MLYAQIMTMKSSVSNQQRAEWLKKRAAWKPPAGVKVLAEYQIPSGANKIIMVFDSPDIPSTMPMRAPWLEYFDIDLHPALAVEDIVKMSAQVLEALGVKK